MHSMGSGAGGLLNDYGYGYLDAVDGHARVLTLGHALLGLVQDLRSRDGRWREGRLTRQLLRQG
jgi:hypothetical protein